MRWVAKDHRGQLRVRAKPLDSKVCKFEAKFEKP